MNDQVLMNDEAARSPTGEILDQSISTPPPVKTETPAPVVPPTQKESTPPSNDSIKPDDSAKPPEPKPGEKPPVAAGAPEAYSEFKAPEGFTLAKETADAITPLFKELNLSQDQAQKLVDFHAKSMIDAAKGPQTTYENLRTDWRSKVTADPDIKAYAVDGKTGLDAVKIDIGRAVATLDPALASEFKAAMDLTGAGDHPAFVKAFWRLSQTIMEGKPVSGANPSPHGQRDPTKGARPTAAQSMYPGLPSAGS